MNMICSSCGKELECALEYRDIVEYKSIEGEVIEKVVCLECQLKQADRDY